MLEDLLVSYEDNDYVYIIEGCMSLYVSDEPLDMDQGPCEICGSYDWPYMEGYAGDIRKAIDEDDFYRICDERNIREKLMMAKNVLSKKSYQELLISLNEMIKEPSKIKTLKKVDI